MISLREDPLAERDNLFSSSGVLFLYLRVGVDMERGEFLLHSRVGSCTVQQRLYAHRQFRHLLVHEISLLDPLSCPSVSLRLQYNQGAPSPDYTFTEHPHATPGTTLTTGIISQPETPVDHIRRMDWLSGISPPDDDDDGDYAGYHIIYIYDVGDDLDERNGSNSAMCHQPSLFDRIEFYVPSTSLLDRSLVGGR